MSLGKIDLPYIERNTSRHGRVRYYFRFDGKRVCRLPDDAAGEEFATEYWKARRSVEAGKSEPSDGAWTMSSPVRPRSFRWLCLQYMASSAYRDLDITTQTKRRQIMESMWAEPLSKAPSETRVFADMPMSALDVGNIEALRDRKRETPFAANERLKILRQVFDTKVGGERLVQNAARLAEKMQVRTDGHHTITPAEIVRFVEHHGRASKATLGIVLLMYTGLRVSDLAKIGPQHRRGDEFRMRMFKNRGRKPMDLTIPIHPSLEQVLAMHPVEGFSYLITDYGQPFSVKGLSQRVSEWFNQAGLPHCTAHSVRKGLATNQAENEATDRMLDAMFGWRDGKTSRVYTARADRARLARQAVSKIRWEGFDQEIEAGAPAKLT